MYLSQEAPGRCVVLVKGNKSSKRKTSFKEKRGSNTEKQKRYQDMMKGNHRSALQVVQRAGGRKTPRKSKMDRLSNVFNDVKREFSLLSGSQGELVRGTSKHLAIEETGGLLTPGKTKFKSKKK